MISKEEYEQAIRAYMDELSIRCIREDPERLRAIPDFAELLGDAISTVGNRDAPEQVRLAAAFGLVDVYVDAEWDRLVDEAFSSYLAASGALSRTGLHGSQGDAIP